MTVIYQIYSKYVYISITTTKPKFSTALLLYYTQAPYPLAISLCGE